jgi:hypothetical protein
MCFKITFHFTFQWNGWKISTNLNDYHEQERKETSTSAVTMPIDVNGMKGMFQVENLQVMKLQVKIF